MFVDDPGGSSDGRTLRKVLARIDVIGNRALIRRLPAWRCLDEPDQVAAELSEELQRLGGTQVRPR